VKAIGSDIVPFATGAAARSAAAIITFRSAFVMAERVDTAVVVVARTEYCTSNLSC